MKLKKLKKVTEFRVENDSRENVFKSSRRTPELDSFAQIHLKHIENTPPLTSERMELTENPNVKNFNVPSLNLSEMTSFESSSDQDD